MLQYDALLVEQTLDQLETQVKPASTKKRGENFFSRETKKSHLQKEERIAPLATDNVTDRTVATIYQLEFDRIKYSLTNYLRVRLKKIEKSARYLKNTPELHSRLSDAESAHLEQYLEMSERCLGQIFLDRLPEHVRTLDDPEMLDGPRLNDYVFAEIMDEVGAVTVDGQEQIDLAKGDLVAIKYQTVQSLVLRDSAKLV